MIITQTLTRSTTVTETFITEESVTVTEEVTKTLIEESFEAFRFDDPPSIEEKTFVEEVSTDSLEQSTTPESFEQGSTPSPSDCATPLPATE